MGRDRLAVLAAGLMALGIVIVVGGAPWLTDFGKPGPTTWILAWVYMLVGVEVGLKAAAAEMSKKLRTAQALWGPDVPYDKDGWWDGVWSGFWSGLLMGLLWPMCVGFVIYSAFEAEPTRVVGDPSGPTRDREETA